MDEETDELRKLLNRNEFDKRELDDMMNMEED